MRKTWLVLCLCLLCGCSAKEAEIAETTEENVVTTESEEISAVDVETVQDTAFGVPCRYVSGEEEVGELKCRKMEVRPEWKTPADGWELTEREDGMLVIKQVYDSDDVLLLPMNYGSNTYVIIGLDGEEETECEPCESTEED